MLSYVARINYAYKGKYMLTVSSRWDGSSKFKDNRWGCSPQLPWHGAFPMKIFMGFCQQMVKQFKTPCQLWRYR